MLNLTRHRVELTRRRVKSTSRPVEMTSQNIVEFKGFLIILEEGS